MLKKLLKPLAHQCAANINQEVGAECLIVANSHQSIVDVARLTTINRQLLTQHNHFLAQLHHCFRQTMRHTTLQLPHYDHWTTT